MCESTQPPPVRLPRPHISRTPTDGRTLRALLTQCHSSVFYTSLPMLVPSRPPKTPVRHRFVGLMVEQEAVRNRHGPANHPPFDQPMSPIHAPDPVLINQAILQHSSGRHSERRVDGLISSLNISHPQRPQPGPAFNQTPGAFPFLLQSPRHLSTSSPNDSVSL